MGVLGLYSYFESKSLGQRRSWTTASSGPPEASSDGKIPTRPQKYFILDGNAYIHHLYCGQFEWIWGGQYASFVKLLIAHITAIQASGFQLQILFDGPLPLQKLRTRLTRDTEKIHKLTRVMGDLEHYHILGLSNSSRGNLGNGSTSSGVLSTTTEGLDALANNAGGGGGAGSRSYSHFLIPPLVMEVTLQTLRSLGVDLMVCDGEADGLVAQLALEKSMDPNIEEAYAVSKDSDYFVYNTGSSTKGGYIPLDSLFVAMNPHTSRTTISATVYSQAAISEHLGILPQFLPLFASLTGNDYLRPDVFEAQIAKALIATTGQKIAGTSNTNHARIKATAAFLKQYGAGLEATTTLEHDNNQPRQDKDRVLEVMDRVLQDRKELYPNEDAGKQQELRCALMESMDQYSSLMPDLNFSALSTSTQTMTGLDRMKEAFRTGQFSFKLMDVVCNKMFWCTPFLEDTDRESAWLVSRELRRWIYGVLARNLASEEVQKQQSETTSSAVNSSEQTLDFDVVEYVRRGDHLSAETVTAASAEELDEILTTAQLKVHKKGSRRISYMEVDVCEDLNGAASTEQGVKLKTDLETAAAHDQLDLASRTSLFLGILGAGTEQVKALPRSFLVLAATLRYLVNALSHSKTRSASVSVANFEVIAFVASVIFLREKYYPEMILGSSSGDSSSDLDPSQEQPKQPSIPSTNHNAASSNSSLSLSDEAPPLTKRSLHLSTQYQHALGSVSLLANALHLENMIPPLATLFDGLLFQQTLVLARGGTSLETRMQFPESVALYHQILAAVEENFIDTGEIDVVVVFRSLSKRGPPHLARTPARDHVQLGIFGPDMEPVNQLAAPTSSSSAAGSTALAAMTTPGSASASGGASLKATKSSGIQKKSPGSSKKRSAGAAGGNGGGHSGSGGRNHGSRNGTGANMFNVLSLGCEF
ncbi:hypothetical protein EC968_004476 [Mortierella alpina]|nr:hypothetical protein EC968_004476 [Mortierella alpina]